MGDLSVKKVQSIIKNNETGRHSDGDGLYLMVPKRGKAYWMYRFILFGKRKEMTIAKIDALSLSNARIKAAELRQQIVEGINPIAERKKTQQVTVRIVDDLFKDWYENSLCKRLKHPNIPKRIYQKEIGPAIGQHTLERVAATDIRSLVQTVADSGRPATANDTLMYCKQLFNYAIQFHGLQVNPALSLSVKDAGGIEESRDRKLSLEEIQHVFHVFRENIRSFGRDNYLACTLLLCLGVRKSELTEAKWDEFELDKALWHLPSARSKSDIGLYHPTARTNRKMAERA